MSTVQTVGPGTRQEDRLVEDVVAPDMMTMMETVAQGSRGLTLGDVTEVAPNYSC